MRFVRGRTFSQASADYHKRLSTGTEVALEFSALLHAFIMVCNTIGYAHSRGVIHRDLKGENVILGDFGEVLVLDWGLAKVVNLPDILADDLSEVAEEKSKNVGLTLHGLALGSPPSMSPEQAAGRWDEVDHRTDIYGLGSILYEILTGQAPFSGTTLHEVLQKVRLEEPLPPKQCWPAVPHGLEAICLRALAKEPGDRYGAAKELGDAVQQWQEAERRQAEQALRASEEQYRSLADLIPGIVWTARADGWIDYANQFWYDFTGFTPEQTMGSGWAAAVHADDLERVASLWTKSLQAGEPIEVDYRIRRKDGVYRWFLAQARPVRDKDRQILKWFGMLTEIENSVRNLRASRQNQS
jgi:eukaryotic-like serine/threonine-protein kinase